MVSWIVSLCLRVGGVLLLLALLLSAVVPWGGEGPVGRTCLELEELGLWLVDVVRIDWGEPPRPPGRLRWEEFTRRTFGASPRRASRASPDWDLLFFLFALPSPAAGDGVCMA